MPSAVIAYVRWTDAVCYRVGRFAMYLIFALLAVLFYSSFANVFTLPALWTLETAQFLMAAYYVLGGAYSMQLGDHVRMDLLYSRWNARRMAFADTITSFCLIAYLIVLLYGGISSTTYAIEYKETSYSSWSPYMAPIKVVMCVGILLMILQAVSYFFKDLARARGTTLDGRPLADDEAPAEAPVEKGV